MEKTLEITETKNRGFDTLREKWNRMSYQTWWGPQIYKLIAGVVIALSTYAISQYALTFAESPLIAFLENVHVPEEKFALYAALANGIIGFLYAPAGAILEAVIIGVSLAGIAPGFVILGATLFISAFSNSTAVAAAMAALPVALIQMQPDLADKLAVTNPLLMVEYGFFILAFILYATIRLDGKLQAFVTPVIFGIFSTSFCTYYKFKHLGLGKNHWTHKMVDSMDLQGATEQIAFDEKVNKAFDLNVNNVVIVCAMLLIIAIIFILFINFKAEFYMKLSVDVRDGIAFAVMFIILVVAFCLLPHYTTAKEINVNYISMGLQIAVAYLVTRPIAKRAPKVYASSQYNGEECFIFISYAHSDMKTIRPYIKKLEKEGYQFWYDTNIKAGSGWQDVIASNLAKCAFFLAFISESSVKSDYCIKEINYATSKNKPIGAIMLDNATLPPVLEMHLASMQAVKRSKYQTDEECLNEILAMDEIKKCIDYGQQN